MPWPRPRQLKPKETDAERAVVRWAEERCIRQVKLNLMFNRGYMDRLFFIPGGRPTLIEFKREGEEQRPLQKSIAEELKRLDYDVHCIDNKEEGIHILQEAILRVAFGTWKNSGKETSSLRRKRASTFASVLQDETTQAFLTEAFLKFKTQAFLQAVAVAARIRSRTDKATGVDSEGASQDRRKVSHQPSVRRTASRSRNGKNKHRAGRDKDS